MISISIEKGQGLTHGLKAYAEYLGYDTSKITKENWNNTLTRLEYIQKDRASDNKNSIYSTDTTKSGWQGKMVVQEGNIEFTDGEIESLFASMGLQTKAEAFESWATESTIEPSKDHGSFKLNKDGNKDAEKYLEELKQIATDYIEIYDENKDGKIDFDEFTIYKNDWFKTFNKNAANEQIKSENTKFTRIFNHLNIDNEKESKNKLDFREIMNFFYTMDAFNANKSTGKELEYDGYITETEYTLMNKWLSEEHLKDGDHSDLLDMYLQGNFNVFKNYQK